MDKKALTEADIRTKFITLAIAGEGGSKWNVMIQMLEERHFTKGRGIAPLTRQERADRVKKRYVFAKYGEKARAVVQALLQKYADGGIRSVESLDILKVAPLTTFGTPVEIVRIFGGKGAYLSAIRELETQLYQEAA